MDTGEFEDAGDDAISMLCALTFEALAFCISQFLSSVQEPQEGMIELIMKRLGVQKSVIITRDLVVSGIYSLFWTICITLFIWGVFFVSEIGFFVLLTFTILNQVQVILRQQIISNILPPKIQPMVVVIYLIFQVSLSFVVVSNVPDKGLSILGCVISPMMQLQLVLHMAYIQRFFSYKLQFNEGL